MSFTANHPATRRAGQGDEPLRSDEADGGAAEARRSGDRRHRLHQFRSLGGRAAGRRISTCWAAWGWRCPIAFGVALAQPQRRVIALEGDGSILMQLGSLATIAGAAAAQPDDRDHGQRHLSDHRRPAGGDGAGHRYRGDRARRGAGAERLGRRRGRFRGADRSGAARGRAVADRLPHRSGKAAPTRPSATRRGSGITSCAGWG